MCPTNCFRWGRGRKGGVAGPRQQPYSRMWMERERERVTGGKNCRLQSTTTLKKNKCKRVKAATKSRHIVIVCYCCCVGGEGGGGRGRRRCLLGESMTVREEEDGHGLLDMRKKKHRTHVSSDMRKTTGNMRTLFNFFYPNQISSNEMNGW